VLLVYLISITNAKKILKLAKIYGVTVERMFNPFWDTIAVNAVKDLLVRPQTTQLISDLLEMSVPEFLVLTQSHTLPWLVMHKKTDVIKRITQARKDDDDLKVHMKTSNLVPILAKLLQQNVRDTGPYIMQLLLAASSGFRDFELTDLMRMEPASIALHLLKAAGEADDEQKPRVCDNFSLISVNCSNLTVSDPTCSVFSGRICSSK
jgi:serine/threonine-protein kinase ATR